MGAGVLASSAEVIPAPDLSLNVTFVATFLTVDATISTVGVAILTVEETPLAVGVAILTVGETPLAVRATPLAVGIAIFTVDALTRREIE